MIKTWRPNLATGRLGGLTKLAKNCVKSGRACLAVESFIKCLCMHFKTVLNIKGLREAYVASVLPCALFSYSGLENICLQEGKPVWGSTGSEYTGTLQFIFKLQKRVLFGLCKGALHALVAYCSLLFWCHQLLQALASFFHKYRRNVCMFHHRSFVIFHS